MFLQSVRGEEEEEPLYFQENSSRDTILGPPDPEMEHWSSSGGFLRFYNISRDQRTEGDGSLRADKVVLFWMPEYKAGPKCSCSKCVIRSSAGHCVVSVNSVVLRIGSHYF